MIAHWWKVYAVFGMGGMTCAAEAALRIALYDDTSAETGNADTDVNVLAKEPSKCRTEKVTAQDVRDGKPQGCDIVCLPGGTGGGQGKALEDAVREWVRGFVKAGGNVGFCAEAYLATDDYRWSIGLLKAKVADKAHWNRGDDRTNDALVASRSLSGAWRVPGHANAGRHRPCGPRSSPHMACGCNARGASGEQSVTDVRQARVRC